MNLQEKIVSATCEIFNTMVMMEVKAGEPLSSPIHSFHSAISGMIGLAGTHKGMLAIHIPEPLAKAITGNFLGIEVEEINEEVQDAIGELANMLGGSIKTALSENGRDIKLSLPSTICGKEYSFQCQDEVEAVLVPFSAPAGEMHVELRLQKD